MYVCTYVYGEPYTTVVFYIAEWLSSCIRMYVRMYMLNGNLMHTASAGTHTCNATGQLRSDS